VLSHALWQSRFGGDRATLGRTIVVEGTPREVVGVMPPGFRFPRRPRSSGSRCGSTRAKQRRLLGLRLDAGRGAAQAGRDARAGEPGAAADDRRIAALFPWPSPMWNADAEALPLQANLVRDVRRPLSCCRPRSGSCC
jgi:hypothetical protein